MGEYRGRNDWEKQFLAIFKRLSVKHHAWQVWQDFIEMSAIAISNAMDDNKEVWQQREDLYLKIVPRYTKEELDLFVQLLAATIMALDDNPAQDFLGSLYMNLDFGSDWHGQFFTPYHVSELMAKINLADAEEVKKKIEAQNYISVADPCCGAGCMLIAFAAACREMGINYQWDVFFYGQDVDPVVAKMCYIQISLLGCPGRVAVGNSLTEPEPKEPEKIWYTPMYYAYIWRWRRISKQVQELMEPVEEEHDDVSENRTEAPHEPITIIKSRPVLREKEPFSLNKFFNIDKWRQSQAERRKK